MFVARSLFGLSQGESLLPVPAWKLELSPLGICVLKAEEPNVIMQSPGRWEFLLFSMDLQYPAGDGMPAWEAEAMY